MWKDLGPKFVLQVWRDAMAAGPRGRRCTDPRCLPHGRAGADRPRGDDRDGDGLPEHDGIPDQTYDTWPMHGPSAYGGSLWLAAVAAAEAMARRLGDDRAARSLGGLVRAGQVAFDVRLWRGDHYAYDAGGGPSSDSLMADQLAGQWYADATGPGRAAARRPSRGRRFGRSTAWNVRRLRGREDGCGQRHAPRRDRSTGRASRAPEVWVGTTYALAAFMIGRGLVDEGWSTAGGAVAVTYGRGLWFRTPEAYDATATTALASTCGPSPSGRSRRPCGASPRATRLGRARQTAAAASSRTRATKRPIRRSASSSCSYEVA